MFGLLCDPAIVQIVYHLDGFEYVLQYQKQFRF